jgi:non-specific serine/threonine protein kinase/serine/threonine-protein kinase
MVRSGHGQSAGALTLLRLQAGVAARRGDDAGAEAMLRKTVAERRALYGRSAGLAVDLLHFARVSTRLGKPRQAIAALDEATPMAAELLGVDTSPTLMCTLARVDALVALGRLDEAQQAVKSVADQSGQMKAPLIDGALALARASLALARENQGSARTFLDEAERRFRDVGPASGNFSRNVDALRTRIATAERAQIGRHPVTKRRR